MQQLHAECDPSKLTGLVSLLLSVSTPSSFVQAEQDLITDAGDGMMVERAKQ